ncbi:MAG: hypothetical protein OJF49_000276 [Ktedonobacterales bacterium]|nr:MAG: hypothetical protein OJF49_000276 [Ktedonobacterales bacterium]
MRPLQQVLVLVTNYQPQMMKSRVDPFVTPKMSSWAPK